MPCNALLCDIRYVSVTEPQLALVKLQYLGDLGCDFIVLKNDEKTVEQIREMNPLGVLVSPGPGELLCQLY